MAEQPSHYPRMAVHMLHASMRGSQEKLIANNQENT